MKATGSCSFAYHRVRPHVVQTKGLELAARHLAVGAAERRHRDIAASEHLIDHRGHVPELASTTATGVGASTRRFYSRGAVYPRRVLRSSPWMVLAFAFACTACGSSSSRPAAPPEPAARAEGSSAPEPVAPPAVAAPAVAGIPTKCASPDAPLCTPDSAFVKRMCNGSFPDVALVLLGKDTPFVRMYMKGDVEGWNADGGASARAKLRFDEELLVLRRRSPPANGIVVGSGGAGYLAMRWDGNCYTLEDNELTTKKPSAPKVAPIPWRLYSEGTKNALLASPKILAAYQRRGKECKGATSGEVTRACETADTALSTTIVAEIRGGLAIPTPEHLP
jgi:hypothetical protein